MRFGPARLLCWGRHARSRPYGRQGERAGRSLCRRNTCSICNPLHAAVHRWAKERERRAHHFTSRSTDGLCAPARLSQPDGQITSDFQKSCQPRESKIFRFRSYPNRSHNFARLAADEGRSRSSRTCGEMRWTRMARWTYAPDAYGEVVWFGRRGAGAKLAGSVLLTTEAIKPFSGKSTK